MWGGGVERHEEAPLTKLLHLFPVLVKLLKGLHIQARYASYLGFITMRCITKQAHLHFGTRNMAKPGKWEWVVERIGRIEVLSSKTSRQEEIRHTIMLYTKLLRPHNITPTRGPKAPSPHISRPWVGVPAVLRPPSLWSRDQPGWCFETHLTVPLNRLSFCGS